MAAHEAAHRVAGVLDVVNHIEVHPPGSLTRTDTDIADAVRHALEWDAALPAEDIRTTHTFSELGEWEHRSYWHSPEHGHRALTHSHNYSREREDQ
jgi:hypothetical protein